MHDPIAFLEAVRAARASSAELARMRAEVDSLSDDEAQPRLAKLARKRLLASNTLTASLDERARWDAANEWLASVLDAPLDAAALAALNAKLTGQAPTFRTAPIFSGPDEYLEPVRVPDALMHLGETTGDVFFDAAVTYITIVTVHPFVNGNGRTARLAADRVLLAAGALPLCFLSPIASHVAQLKSGTVRDPRAAIATVFAAIAESYATVLG